MQATINHKYLSYIYFLPLNHLEFITQHTTALSTLGARGRNPRRKGHTLGEWVEIFIEPVAKGRPRFKLQGRHVVTFTPKKTHDYERDVARAYLERCEKYYSKETPLHVAMQFAFPAPKSATKARRKAIEDGKEMYTKKPDVDNLVKAVLDALNGVAYEDDAQIVVISAGKCYTDATDGFVRVKITPVGGQA